MGKGGGSIEKENPGEDSGEGILWEQEAVWKEERLRVHRRLQEEERRMERTVEP